MKIHPAADVQSDNIGPGTQIWQYVVILQGAKIGCNCNINSHVFIENDVVIGDNVTIKSGVQLWDGVHIESDVFIGPNVTFTNDLTPRSKQYPDHFAKVEVKRGASVGANATIIGPGIIGSFALVGAGAVVTHEVENYSIVTGNPARKSGYITKEGKRLDLGFADKETGEQYELVNNELVRKS